MGKPNSKHTAKWKQLLLVIVLLPVAVALVPLVLVLFLISTICLHVLIWLFWCQRGRNILFVYSDSPIWHDYIEEKILPRLGTQAMILNWSQRKRWRLSLARMAFYHFGGYRNYNPLAVVFRPFHRSRSFRFWRPFRDYKHGRPEALLKMEAAFFELVESDIGDSPV